MSDKATPRGESEARTAGPNNFEPEKCRCGINDAQADHACPYQSEINDDDEILCSCCDECTHECAMDI